MDEEMSVEASQPQKIKASQPQEVPKLEALEAKFPLQIAEYPNGKIAYRDMKPDVLRQDGDIPLVLMSRYS